MYYVRVGKLYFANLRGRGVILVDDLKEACAFDGEDAEFPPGELGGARASATRLLSYGLPAEVVSVTFQVQIHPVDLRAPVDTTVADAARRR